MDLCVIILTSNLNTEVKPPKFLPKVCFAVGTKTMIEICLDNVIRLNPKKIIIMVSRHNILYINKIIKYSEYAKLISFCITDNSQLIIERKISLAKECYHNQNVLVVPGNCPLLSYKHMFRLISENRNIKINDNLFYMKKDHLDKIDFISEYSSENILPIEKIKQVENQDDWEAMKIIFDEKNKKIKKSK
jgi:bifunctional N-acetylglucosamine-1-phosphate-uridyltransferase/glucosamine-1-phosphate-acetyltransferase GlmU-like protein